MGTLVKNNQRLFPTFPSFFDDMLTRDWFNWPLTHHNQSARLVPAVNVKETDDAYELEVVAPGMSKQDFKVELDNNLLVISAQKEDKHEEQEGKGNFAHREFSYSSFTRSFSLPERMIKGDEIAAKYNDGILHIIVPKADEAKVKPPKQIKIS
jgi:HSP20 family protein